MKRLIPILSAVVLGTSFVSCGKTLDPSQVVVIFDAEPGLAGHIDRVEVTVLGGKGHSDDNRQERLKQVFSGADLGFPLSLSITPLGDDDSRIFEVVGEASAGESKVVVRAITGFVSRQTRYLQLVFYDECRGATCNEEQTCNQEGCKSSEVTIASLGTKDPVAPAMTEATMPSGNGDGTTACFEGDGRCSDSVTAQTCGKSGDWGADSTCSGDAPICRDDLKGCGCEEGGRRCTESTQQRCEDGIWASKNDCENHCLVTSGMCVDCDPVTERCDNGAHEACSAEGSWEPTGGCAGTTVNCGDCNLGESCGADAECSSDNCVDDKCRPGENCANGIDDDDDGDVDCSDSECSTFRCLPVPTNWSGPVVITEGRDVPNNCPLPYSSERVNGDSGNLDWQQVACTTCACNDGVSCVGQPSLRRYVGTGSCNAQFATQTVDLVENDCTQMSVNALGARILSVPGSTGTCGVLSGNAISFPPPFTWQFETLACGLPSANVGGCSTDEICAPGSPIGFEAQTFCVYRSGNRSCPPNYIDKRIVYGGHNDSRSCEGVCECNKVGACERIQLYSERDQDFDTCSGSTAWIFGRSSCIDTYQGVVWAPDIRCEATTSSPTGSVIGTLPTTVCCDEP